MFWKLLEIEDEMNTNKKAIVLSLDGAIKQAIGDSLLRKILVIKLLLIVQIKLFNILSKEIF